MNEKAHLWADLIANTGKSGPLWAIFYFVLHPGYFAITLHRLSYHLYKSGAIGKIISKALWRVNVLFTKCHISPLAQIGPSLCLPHAIGIVIGEGVVIGGNVTLYQNVTLGKKNAAEALYPRLEDHVCVYSGACVLGGVTIGESATIGASAVVLENVPARTTAAGNPARIIGTEK